MWRGGYLVAAGLSPAPVQQHLLDGVGVGNAEAGGPLNLSNRLVPRAKDRRRLNVVFKLEHPCGKAILSEKVVYS